MYIKERGAYNTILYEEASLPLITFALENKWGSLNGTLPH
jgi:hypothetical protein